MQLLKTHEKILTREYLTIDNPMSLKSASFYDITRTVNKVKAEIRSCLHLDDREHFEKKITKDAIKLVSEERLLPTNFFYLSKHGLTKIKIRLVH